MKPNQEKKSINTMLCPNILFIFWSFQAVFIPKTMLSLITLGIFYSQNKQPRLDVIGTSADTFSIKSFSPEAILRHTVLKWEHTKSERLSWSADVLSSSRWRTCQSHSKEIHSVFINLLQDPFNWVWNGLNLIPMPLYDLHKQTRPLARRLAISK